MKCQIIYLHRLEFTGSGQTLQVLRDYDSLARLGHDVHVFYRACRELSGDGLVEAITRHGLTAETSLRFHFLPEGLGGKRRLFRAADALMEESDLPVVIAVRTMDHARLALALRQRAQRLPVSVIIELHEGAFPHMVYREQGRRVRAWLSRRSERYVLREVDGIIATVGSQVTLLDEIFPVHARATVLPNGVAIEAFRNVSKDERGKSRDNFRLRYAGQFPSWRNTDLMLSALRYLPAETVLDLAGGKIGLEDETRSLLMGAAKRLGVANRVNYVGNLHPRDVPAFLCNADALLLPLGNQVQARYFTCPMKLFDYAASGVPMVAVRQPTVLSLIQDGVHALLVEPGSPEDMARAIRRLQEDHPLGESLADNARVWVEQFTYGKRAARHQHFIMKIMAPTN